MDSFYLLLKRSCDLRCMKILKAIIVVGFIFKIDLIFYFFDIRGGPLLCWLLIEIFVIFVVGFLNTEDATRRRYCE